jgi:hypothetical protein
MKQYAFKKTSLVILYLRNFHAAMNKKGSIKLN